MHLLLACTWNGDSCSRSVRRLRTTKSDESTAAEVGAAPGAVTMSAAAASTPLARLPAGESTPRTGAFPASSMVSTTRSATYASRRAPDPVGARLSSASLAVLTVRAAATRDRVHAATASCACVQHDTVRWGDAQGARGGGSPPRTWARTSKEPRSSARWALARRESVAARGGKRGAASDSLAPGAGAGAADAAVAAAAAAAAAELRSRSWWASSTPG